MKITGKKLLVFCLLLAVIVILGAILYYLSLSRANNCEHHAEVNQRFNEMLVLVRVAIPQCLADNPDTSTKEFAEYCKKIRNEREFYILIATHMDEVCHSKLWRKDLRKYVCENALGQKILIPDDGETLSF